MTILVRRSAVLSLALALAAGAGLAAITPARESATSGVPAGVVWLTPANPR